MGKLKVRFAIFVLALLTPIVVWATRVCSDYVCGILNEALADEFPPPAPKVAPVYYLQKPPSEKA